MKSPNMRAIAERCGVSAQTVSRILSNQGEKHSAKTRELVLRTAHDMGYRPNLPARAVFGRKTMTVGIMVPYGTQDPFYGQVICGAHDRLAEEAYAPILVLETDKVPMLDQVHRLVDRRVDGIIIRPITGKEPDDYLREPLEMGVPMVAVGMQATAKREIDFVGTDDQAGGAKSAELLLALGHRRLLFLAWDLYPKINLEAPIGQRWTGFRDAVAKFAPTAEASLVYFTTDGEQPIDEACYAAAREVLSSASSPTGVGLGLDLLAYGVYRAARELKQTIPDDLSVVGFADADIAAHLFPPLTTLRQSPLEIGRRAADLLMERINDRDHAGEERSIRAVRLMPELVERDSTAAPR